MRFQAPLLAFRSPAALFFGVAILLSAAGCSKEKGEVSEGTAPVTTPSTVEVRRFDDLTIELMMQGPGLVGTSPSRVRWSADGKTVYFHWNNPAKLDSLNAIDPLKAYDNYVSIGEEASWYALDVASQAITKLDDDVADMTAPLESAWNHARTRAAEIRGGDLYLVDRWQEQTRQVTQTLEREHDVQISYEGDVVYFVSGDNLFALDWDGGPIRQLTNLKLSAKPSEKEPSEQRQFLIDQQKELFTDFGRDKPEPRKKHPEAVYLGEGWSIRDIMVSASGHYAAVELSKEGGGREPLVPHFVTESGYMETRKARTKVGDLRDESHVALVDLRGDSLIEIEIDPGIAHDVRGWSPVGDVLLTRGIPADFKVRYFYAIDPAGKDANGKVVPRVLDEYGDEAWVGGPGFYRTGAWLQDGSGIFFVSEEDGFSHLYTVTLDGTRHEKLTEGGWEVYSAEQSSDGALWYLITNEGEVGSHRLWVMNADGSNRRLLTADVGEYSAEYDPDGTCVALLRSTLTRPDELYLYDIAAGQMSEPLTQSTTEVFRSFAWIWPEILNIKADDGGTFRAHIFRPDMFGKRPNGRGVVFIHGAGYLQNVMSWWSYYYREYMFNHFLAMHGYTVLNVDFRASAGYGRASRVAIYKHMGGRDLDDVIDAARYLVANEGVGKEQVGVYGGSYGGFLTVMALFKYPDVIKAGGAIRSVTDWAHYNHWYTSRILGLPEEDPEAYERSSPINFVDGYEGGLLMLHGLVDDNVLAADVIRLSEVMMEKGKDDWDLMLYPMESHAFKRASSWTDEYKRIYKLFEEELDGR